MRNSGQARKPWCEPALINIHSQMMGRSLMEEVQQSLNEVCGLQSVCNKFKSMFQAEMSSDELWLTILMAGFCHNKLDVQVSESQGACPSQDSVTCLSAPTYIHIVYSEQRTSRQSLLFCPSNFSFIQCSA